MPNPPTSVRFCVVCEQKTTFKYNRNVLHSECIQCGNRLGIRSDRVIDYVKSLIAERYKPKEENYQSILAYLELRIKQLGGPSGSNRRNELQTLKSLILNNGLQNKIMKMKETVHG